MDYLVKFAASSDLEQKSMIVGKMSHDTSFTEYDLNSSINCSGKIHLLCNEICTQTIPITLPPPKIRII